MKRTRFYSAVLAVMMAAGTLLGLAAPAKASNENTWRYLTYGAGAVTLYGAAKKNLLIGLLDFARRPVTGILLPSRVIGDVTCQVDTTRLSNRRPLGGQDCRALIDRRGIGRRRCDIA